MPIFLSNTESIWLTVFASARNLNLLVHLVLPLLLGFVKINFLSFSIYYAAFSWFR